MKLLQTYVHPLGVVPMPNHILYYYPCPNNYFGYVYQLPNTRNRQFLSAQNFEDAIHRKRIIKVTRPLRFK